MQVLLFVCGHFFKLKMKKIEAFISYADEDSAIGDVIKAALQSRFGFSAFLSSRDTKIAQNFEEKILQTLPVADIFIPLLSKHFKKSIYSHQETGMAVVSGIQVFPIRLDKKSSPKGFISKCFGYPLFEQSGNLADKAATAIFLAILGDKKYQKIWARTRHSIICALEDSNEFVLNINIIEVMVQIKGFSKSQLARIVYLIKNERCVRDCYALPSLKNYLKKTYGVQT